MSYRVLDLSSFALFWTDKRTRTPPSIACHRSPQKWPRSQVKLSSNYLVIGIDLRYHGQESLRLAVVLRRIAALDRQALLRGGRRHDRRTGGDRERNREHLAIWSRRRTGDRSSCSTTSPGSSSSHRRRAPGPWSMRSSTPATLAPTSTSRGRLQWAIPRGQQRQPVGGGGQSGIRRAFVVVSRGSLTN